MNKRDIQKLGVLNRFPVKGSAVIGYFVEQGEVTGTFYAALVVQSGRKQYRLRWFDNSTQIFESIKGKNSRYQDFQLLGYLSLSDYKRLYKGGFSLDDVPPIEYEPCSAVVDAYRDQAKEISKIKEEYEAQRSQIPDKIINGQSIIFIYIRCLDQLLIVEGAFSRMDGSDVYANVDEELEETSDEGSYLYIPRNLLLGIGNETKKS